jgi:hypothetical protein
MRLLDLGGEKQPEGPARSCQLPGSGRKINPKFVHPQVRMGTFLGLQIENLLDQLGPGQLLRVPDDLGLGANRLGRIGHGRKLAVGVQSRAKPLGGLSLVSAAQTIARLKATRSRKGGGDQ